jgi:hypothetical protein
VLFSVIETKTTLILRSSSNVPELIASTDKPSYFGGLGAAILVNIPLNINP